VIKAVRRWAASRPRSPLNPDALVITLIAAIVITGVVWRVYAPCLDLIVASSNEKYELLSRLALTYNAERAERVERRCVHVIITSVASGTAEKALANDWRGLPARPHVWSPAATTWLLVLSADRAGRADILPSVSQSLLQSPLVIAMPASMWTALHQSVERVGWHDVVARVRDPAGWARFGRPWGPFRLGQTTPLISTSGLHSIISLSNAAQSEADPDAFLRDFDSSVVHYADSVRTFLTTLYAADLRNEAVNYVSAIAVEEKQVFDYNRGNPTSSPCNGICGREPNEKLVAIYPKEGTFYADHPYAILNWPDDPDASLHRQAALNFELYLEEEASQRYFQSQGFRNDLRQAGPELALPYFDPAEPRSLYSAPLPSVIRDTIDHWTKKIRKPANATLLLDLDPGLASASGGGATRFASVTTAVARTLTELGLDDTIALRTFPAASGEAYRRVLEATKLGQTPSQLSLRVEALRPETGTRAVYGAIRAAAEEVQTRYSPTSVNAVVVVTTGNNQTSDTRDALVSWFKQQTDKHVLLFVVALSTAALADLAPVVEAAGGVPYDASDARTIEDAVRKALLNL